MRTIFLTAFLFFATVASAQHTILWKITAPSSKRVSYLLGTYHLFGNSFVDSLPVIREKLQECSMVITETRMERDRIRSYYNARPGSDTIYSVLSKEDIDLVASVFKKGQINITQFTPGEIFAKMQAFYPKYKCAVLNRGDSGSMDEYIQQMGAQQQKTLYYLETDSLQMEKLSLATSQFDWTFFKRNMPAVLARYRSTKPDDKLCAMMNEYASFAMDYQFKKKCNILNNAASNEALIVSRNADWMQKLPPLLENNTCFIAVGIAHLYATCGLPEQLKQLGYTVEPISMK